MTFKKIQDVDLTRFNKIANQATAQMAADKEAVGSLRVHTAYLSGVEIRSRTIMLNPVGIPKSCS